jgi:heme A synthase
MALVVTAPSPVEAHAGFVQVAARPSRLGGWLKWAALAGAVLYSAALVTESIARFALASATFEVNSGPSAVAVSAATPVALLAVLGVCAATWLARREDAGLLLVTTLAVVFSAIRALATPSLVALDLPTLADVTALALGLLVLGALVWAATRAFGGSTQGRVLRAAEADLFRRVVDVTTFLVFAVGLTGVTVRAVGASWACQDAFPDCNGLGILPFGRDPAADIQLYHRLLAYGTLALVGWVTVEAFRSLRAASRAACSSSSSRIP